jgi:hypothetical protein
MTFAAYRREKRGGALFAQAADATASANRPNRAAARIRCDMVRLLRSIAAFNTDAIIGARRRGFRN